MGTKKSTSKADASKRVRKATERPLPALERSRGAKVSPAEAQNKIRGARGIISAVRVCVDQHEEVSAYTLELVEELLGEIDDALGGMVTKEPAAVSAAVASEARERKAGAQ